MTAPMVDYKIHWLKMMSVPESRAVVGRHDGINGRDRQEIYGVELYAAVRLAVVDEGLTHHEAAGFRDKLGNMRPLFI